MWKTNATKHFKISVEIYFLYRCGVRDETFIWNNIVEVCNHMDRNHQKEVGRAI